jgi:eukaryotic-like serine/threonine-protein kinase
MAGIVFKCPLCKHSIASDDNLCGEIAVCPECQEEIVVPIPGLEADNTYGDFKLLERLGTGASGEVWLAHQQSMDRKVALKILCPKLSSDKTFIDRFMKEAKNSAKLAHPNIVTAFYAGQDKGMYYLAISYINGETIEAKLERDKVYDEKEALKIIRSIAVALQYAWDEFKILHRDIKPANIIVNKKGVAMLLDLGISKSMLEDSSLTMTGTVIGTPYYMSPEQAIADKDMDFRSDIYSLGTTLYQMLTGTVPYYATTAMAIIMKHINEKFKSPRTHNPNISKYSSRLIEIMMAKKKGERQQSWAALIKDIDLVLEGKNPKTLLPSSGSTVQRDAATVGDAGKADKTTSGASTDKTKKSSKKKKIIAIVTAIIIAAMIPIAIITVAVIIFFSSKKETRTTQGAGRRSLTPLPSTPTVETQKTTSMPNETINKTSGNTKPESFTGPPPPTTTAKNSVPENFQPVSLENAFKEVADQLDITKNTSLKVKSNWGKIDNKEFTWFGKVVNVKGGWGKAEVHVACPNRSLYKGFNAILVTYDKDAAAELKMNENVKFKGNVYNYKPKRNGLVILYMTNVKFLKE